MSYTDDTELASQPQPLAIEGSGGSGPRRTGLPCFYCQAEYHEFCSNPSFGDDDCCCPVEVLSLEKTYRDGLSTGRKRAALEAIIKDGEQCNWAGLANAGGGVIPIVGCRPEKKNLAEHRHHGPDKCTLNNSPGNLHKICADCHNRWHTENDEFYGVRPENPMAPFIPQDREILPHDPETLATESDYADSDKRWSGVRPKKAKAE